MKDDYRKTTNDRTVKYDSDPANDYSDGYNAGRRFNPPPKMSKILLWLLIPLAILLLLVGGYFWFKYVDSTQSAQPTTTVRPSPTANPAPSPSTLPGVGGVEDMPKY